MLSVFEYTSRQLSTRHNNTPTDERLPQLQRTLSRRTLSTRPVIGRSSILFPWLGLERQVPAEQLRVRVTEFSSQAALCYALLGGVSAAALLSPDTSSRVGKTAQPPLPLSERVSTVFGVGWSERLGPSLWCSSVFFNLQGLMASMLTLAHANAMPDAGIAALIRAQPVALHATGLCMWFLRSPHSALRSSARWRASTAPKRRLSLAQEFQRSAS